MFTDEELYRFEDQEIVFFAPGSSMHAVGTESLGEFADAYAEAARQRGDVMPSETVWVMPDRIRGEARLWREFTRNPDTGNLAPRYVRTLDLALVALRRSPALGPVIRSCTGFALV